MKYAQNINQEDRISTAGECMREYSSNEFEIVGCSYQYGEPTGYHYAGKGFNVSIHGKEVYKRLFIKRKVKI
jgi:hypothetical protein